MSTSKKILLLFVMVYASFGMLYQNSVLAGDLINGLWVWSDEVTDPNSRHDLIHRSSGSNVDALYLSVYQSNANTEGRNMYEESDLSALITEANNAGIDVWAAYGNYDWPQLGCDPFAFPRQRMAEVVAYNAANPTAQFDGVMLDVEPLEPAHFDSLFNLYDCIIENDLKPNGLKAGAAIRFFWDSDVEFPLEGPTKPAYEHIIDMDFDKIVVMGYRDFAGTACSDNGIICVDQHEIAYAESLNKSSLILVGLETLNYSPSGAEEHVTFFEEGQEELNLQMGLVTDHFVSNTSFGGFALHEYGNVYLGDLPDLDANGKQKWPAINNPIWEPGDLFVGVLNGNYLIYDNEGNSKGTISTGYQGLTGTPAFDANFDLYVPTADESFIVKFGGHPPHDIQQTIDFGLNSQGKPFFFSFAANGDFYVGTSSSNNMDVVHYDSTGVFQQIFVLEPDSNYSGSDLIFGMDLASDQHTIYYSPISFGFTAQSSVIKRFDVANNQQLEDWAVVDGWSGEIVLLPPKDGSGGLLISQFTEIKRLDANGDLVRTYTVPIPPEDPSGVGFCNGAAGQQALWELALDPNGTSFWTIDFCRANLFKINIETGAIEAGPINTGTGPNTVFGLGIRGANNTEIGSPIVELPSSTTPATLDFSNVTVPGTTTLIPYATVPTAPMGFELAGESTSAAFEISTTAVFDGFVNVCIDYSPLGIATEAEELSLKLSHYDGINWVDITSPNFPNILNNLICGSVSSFSPFAIFKAISPEIIIQDMINQVNNMLSEGELKKGHGKSLTAKLKGVLNKLNQGKKNAASNKLNAFVNQLNGLINGGKLDAEEAQPLIEGANAVIAQLDGLSKISNEGMPQTGITPKVYKLAQNYPNPFNPTTTIEYALPKAGHVRIEIYDILGRRIKPLVNINQPVGRYQTFWDGMDENNIPVAAGVYFYKMQAGDFVEVNKLVLVR